MRIIEGFKLRSVAGEMIVSGESVAQIDFNKLIALNESAAYLWNEVEGKDFSIETLADLLVQKYGIDSELATNDATAISQNWLDVGLITK
ncbi:MAG: PqqD family protein [Rikenellaceae bacterium]